MREDRQKSGLWGCIGRWADRLTDLRRLATNAFWILGFVVALAATAYLAIGDLIADHAVLVPLIVAIAFGIPLVVGARRLSARVEELESRLSTGFPTKEKESREETSCDLEHATGDCERFRKLQTLVLRAKEELGEMWASPATPPQYRSHIAVRIMDQWWVQVRRHLQTTPDDQSGLMKDLELLDGYVNMIGLVTTDLPELLTPEFRSRYSKCVSTLQEEVSLLQKIDRGIPWHKKDELEG